MNLRSLYSGFTGWFLSPLGNCQAGTSFPPYDLLDAGYLASLKYVDGRS
jgi:hypothetical protein